MKTKKKNEIIDEVAKVSMQLHEAEDPERKLCTENGKVFAHQMQTSTSENRSEQTDLSQDFESAKEKPKKPSKWLARCKRWFSTYPIIVMILVCSLYSFSGTNAKIAESTPLKRYSDADTEIITQLTTDQLTSRLESHGLEYISDFYEGCELSRNHEYAKDGKEYAVDFKFKPQNVSYVFSIVIVFNMDFNYKKSDKYLTDSAKYEQTEFYEKYEKKISNRRNTETYLYIKTKNLKFFINFIDNKKTNSNIYNTICDTIICNIKWYLI